ncbi:P-loop containing nucleoside triphosphate hydrolase protein [Phaeosphaeriaceae sp. PMI808]|nr:P-loop containing nucleoside triphosphate hydrolase protein [Phaeosphaeriaceae sp. PMI808]
MSRSNKVLQSLGGIGKTQLAVEFARRHHRRFSAVFWLDGRSADSVKRSIAGCASRIPRGQISETSRTYTAEGGTDIDAVVREVMGWLARPDNTAWLLIFDNVDREYNPRGGDPDAYDVTRYFSGGDHGSVLITTRLTRLEQLGESQRLGRVDNAQARAIFESWYKKKHNTNESGRLLELLDGLPLAIAQAGAYLQESGVGIKAYLRFYEQQWSELMESRDVADAPLQDYPNRSVWTTWAISYQAIRNKHQATANLLLLWSFLDNKNLWHGLFAATCEASAEAARMLSEWVGDVASSELAFSRAMQMLRNYSLIEAVEDTTSYATHPVVHRWAYHYRGKDSKVKLSQLAVIAVGMAVPYNSTKEYSAMQRRLLPHAQVCSRWVIQSQAWQGDRIDKGDGKDVMGLGQRQTVLDAIHSLGMLYADQGKLAEAEQMYERALRGREEALGLNNLGLLYADQGKLAEAEQMYERALRGREEALGPNHTSTLDSILCLGNLYAILLHEYRLKRLRNATHRETPTLFCR